MPSKTKRIARNISLQPISNTREVQKGTLTNSQPALTIREVAEEVYTSFPDGNQVKKERNNTLTNEENPNSTGQPGQDGEGLPNRNPNSNNNPLMFAALTPNS